MAAITTTGSSSPDLRGLYRKCVNVIMLTLCSLAALVAVGVLLLVLYYVMSQGITALSWKFFSRLPNHEDEMQGGMVQSIFGTGVLLGLAALIGLPFGILGGIYQLEARGRFASMVRFFTDVLNGIPSIVIGIFVYAVAVLPVAQAHPDSGYSAYAGGFALGIMMIPTVMRTTEEILRLVPFSMREASLGLGATGWRTMWSVVLPAARGGIITGVMLALARIAGETAPLIFTILGNEWMPMHRVSVLGMHPKVPTIDGPIDALPWRIYQYAISVDSDQNHLAWGGAVVLISMILILSIVARFVTRSKFMEEK